MFIPDNYLEELHRKTLWRWREHLLRLKQENKKIPSTIIKILRETLPVVIEYIPLNDSIVQDIVRICNDLDIKLPL